MTPNTAAQTDRSSTPPRTRPMTGAEYLESVRDGREIWIYGERVKDVTTHPAFRNTVRMIARLYDALHDPARKEILTTGIVLAALVTAAAFAQQPAPPAGPRTRPPAVRRRPRSSRRTRRSRWNSSE